MKKILVLLSLLIAFSIQNLIFGQADTLTILHINDTHSNLTSHGPRNAQLVSNRGGIARATEAGVR